MQPAGAARQRHSLEDIPGTQPTTPPASKPKPRRRHGRGDTSEDVLDGRGGGTRPASLTHGNFLPEIFEIQPSFAATGATAPPPPSSSLASPSAPLIGVKVKAKAKATAGHGRRPGSAEKRDKFRRRPDSAELEEKFRQRRVGLVRSRQAPRQGKVARSASPLASSERSAESSAPAGQGVVEVDASRIHMHDA